MSGLDDLIKGASGSGGGGLGDLIGGMLGGRSSGSGGGLGGGMLGALLPVVASMLANGGLEKLLAGMQSKGLSAEADSWVSSGPNKQVGSAQVRDVLGEDEITRISEKLGISTDEAAQAVAAVLPDVVDQVTPAGKLPPNEELDSAFGRLESLSPKG